jgi:hypothetical protein
MEALAIWFKDRCLAVVRIDEGGYVGLKTTPKLDALLIGIGLND